MTDVGDIGEKVAAPLPRLPARRRNSARRTQTLEVRPQSTWDRDLHLLGIAADSWTDADGQVHAVEPATVRVDIDAQSRITGLSAPVPDSVRERFLGQNAVSGFRALVTATDEIRASSLVAGLLDDLPIVRLISGYARLMKEPRRVYGAPHQMILNICRGWAEGATPHRLSLAGEPVVNTTTPAPALQQMLTDPTDFHAEPETSPNSMRRRRLIEVTPDGDGYAVYEYLRDSYIDDDGGEGALHEYVVRARVDRSFTVEAIEVEPRSLPFAECPLAAPNAGVLVGTSLRDVHRSVRSNLSGTSGCTHLSDTLRFLRFTEALATADGHAQSEAEQP